jgi:hypothetical protein
MACGFECQAFYTAKLDLATEVSFEKMIGGLKMEVICWRKMVSVQITWPHASPVFIVRAIVSAIKLN